MKARIELPKAWARLRYDKPIKVGDRYLNLTDNPAEAHWDEVPEEMIGKTPEQIGLPVLFRLRARNGRPV